jgi:probable F420-dependent oxidoreductase
MAAKDANVRPVVCRELEECVRQQVGPVLRHQAIVSRRSRGGRAHSIGSLAGPELDPGWKTKAGERMKVGVFVTVGHPGSDRAYLEAAGRAAEEHGFDSLWVAEHVVLFDEYASRYPYDEAGRIPVRGDAGLLGPFSTLSFLAAVTERIRLGTGICLVPQRNPLYTAREAADVDWLSGGRLDLGVGVGWLAEEFAALGVPFERRGARCRSYLEVMKRLWCDELSQYSDEFYTLPPCRQFPKPLQKPHPPLHFGGESDAALRRVADVGQGWYGFNLDPAGLTERMAKLGELCTTRGRDLAEIEISVSPYLRSFDPIMLDGYRAAGAQQVILPVFGRSRDEMLARMDKIAATVLGLARRMGTSSANASA